jgi:hypothetical protein
MIVRDLREKRDERDGRVRGSKFEVFRILNPEPGTSNFSCAPVAHGVRVSLMLTTDKGQHA